MRNQVLEKDAKRKRLNSTVVEARLWQAFKGRRCVGVKFRRQSVVGSFILDFYDLQTRLCIEVDGAGHLDESQRQRDLDRTAWLNANDIKVIRFWNSFVLNNLNSVLRRVEHEVSLRLPPPAAARRPPPQAGEV